MTTQSQVKFLLMTTLFMVLMLMAYYVFNAPDRRNAGERISDAVEKLSDGAEAAAGQLKDRTPAVKLGDAAKDAGNNIKESTNQQ